MSERIRLVRGDTLPNLVVTLQSLDTGIGMDLSSDNITVTMKFRSEASPENILYTLVGTKLAGSIDVDGNVISTPTTLGAGGRVEFIWIYGALDVDPGYYEGEVTVDYGGGTRQTVYTLLKFSIRADF